MDFSALNSTCLAVFGEAVVYQAPGAAGREISVVRDRVQRDGELASNPLRLFAVREDFVDDPVAGATVTIGAVEYVVVEAIPEQAGSGWHLVANPR